MPAKLGDEASAQASRSRNGVCFTILDDVVSWLLGVSLLYSSVPHLANPYFFLGSVYDYNLVGAAVGQITAMVLPFLQLVLAACLIGNFLRNAAHAITLLMLTVFLSAQTSAKLRGLDIACGCFGPRHDTVIGPLTLAVIYGLFFLGVARLVGYWLPPMLSRMLSKVGVCAGTRPLSLSSATPSLPGQETVS